MASDMNKDVSGGSGGDAASRLPAKRELPFPTSYLKRMKMDDRDKSKLTRKLLKVPEGRAAIEQLMTLLKTGEFDEEAYFKNIMSKNPKTTAAVKSFKEIVMQKHPGMKEEHELSIKRIHEDPVYKRLAENTDPITARRRYMSDKNLLLELARTMGHRVGTKSVDNDIPEPVQEEVPSATAANGGGTATNGGGTAAGPPL